MMKPLEGGCKYYVNPRWEKASSVKLLKNNRKRWMNGWMDGKVLDG
jgi:hypothetical protein